MKEAFRTQKKEVEISFSHQHTKPPEAIWISQKVPTLTQSAVQFYQLNCSVVSDCPAQVRKILPLQVRFQIFFIPPGKKIRLYMCYRECNLNTTELVLCPSMSKITCKIFITKRDFQEGKNEYHIWFLTIQTGFSSSEGKKKKNISKLNK